MILSVIQPSDMVEQQVVFHVEHVWSTPSDIP